MESDQNEKRIKILEPKIKKWKWVTGTAVSGSLMVAGAILMLLSGSYNYRTTILSIGIVTFCVGFIYLIINVIMLSKVSDYQKEYDSLIKQRDSSREDTDADDTLLKLLSEGKITVDEYKRLSKK